MKKVQLNKFRGKASNKGFFALVDDEDFPIISRYKWTLLKKPGNNYAVTLICGKSVKMHRFILNPTKQVLVDHINRNGLDNQKSNLRFCTTSQNGANRRVSSGKTSIYLGVHFIKKESVFRSRIKCNGVEYHIGSFKNEIDAAKARDKKAKELFGDFANLNFK